MVFLGQADRRVVRCLADGDGDIDVTAKRRNLRVGNGAAGVSGLCTFDFLDRITGYQAGEGDRDYTYLLSGSTNGVKASLPLLRIASRYA